MTRQESELKLPRRALWFDDSARHVFFVWLFSRVALWAFVFRGSTRPAMPLPVLKAKGLYIGVSSFWLGPWTTYDSKYYIEIAQSGYTPLRSVFFPLYPLILRLFGGSNASENTLALIGVLVSNACFLGALWLLFLLTRDEWGETVARRAVWIEAFFPAAAFSAAVYTESLFLFLSLGLFWFARKKQWWASGVCGLLAGLARNSGPILFLALLLDQPKEPLSSVEKKRRALCALAPLVGFLVFQGWLRFQFGSAASPLAIQKIFRRELTFPLWPILHDAHNLLFKSGAWRDMMTFPQLAGCLGTFALLWVYRRRFSPGKLLFVGAVVLVSIALPWKSEPQTISTMRYLFGAFPAAQLLGLWSLSAFPSRRATLEAGLLLWLVFYLNSVLFGQKYFLG